MPGIEGLDWGPQEIPSAPCRLVTAVFSAFPLPPTPVHGLVCTHVHAHTCVSFLDWIKRLRTGLTAVRYLVSALVTGQPRRCDWPTSLVGRHGKQGWEGPRVSLSGALLEASFRLSLPARSRVVGVGLSCVPGCGSTPPEPLKTSEVLLAAWHVLK